jgi:predicted DNA-binding transcriptional regulator AlpA
LLRYLCQESIQTAEAERKIEVAIKEETEKAMYNPAISQKEFLTVEEACQLINASRWTIYRLIDKGELKAGNWAEVPVFPEQLSTNYSN